MALTDNATQKAATTTSTNTYNSLGNAYPWTKMNFLVTVSSIGGTSGATATAAFSEATGMEATIDVIEFRQGDSRSLSPVKVPGLVKHGNVTLKYGYTDSNTFRDWAAACVSDTRGTGMKRAKVLIELLDVTGGMPQSNVTTGKAANQYILEDAWVCKYTAPDMNALQSEIAIETLEIAFERLTIPSGSNAAGGDNAGGDTGAAGV